MRFELGSLIAFMGSYKNFNKRGNKMKSTILLITSLLVVQFASAETANDYKLPENGKIQTAILSGSYGCKDAGPFKVLNLNGETYLNGNYYPELQINFACGAKPMLEGTDLSLIADIGDKSLEDLDFYLSLMPKWQTGQSHNFRVSAEIKENNTYAMILNTFKFRGLLVFRVISYRDNILTIQYATRKYSLIQETQKSDFINYEKKNSN